MVGCTMAESFLLAKEVYRRTQSQPVDHDSYIGRRLRRLPMVSSGNFLFDHENGNIVRLAGLFATLCNNFSSGVPG